jgi:hypothetical protein
LVNCPTFIINSLSWQTLRRLSNNRCLIFMELYTYVFRS